MPGSASWSAPASCLLLFDAVQTDNPVCCEQAVFRTMLCGLQLHAAVVELWAGKDAEIKYSTVQNWYPGDAEGNGGIYNFVTKRALCHGAHSKVSWPQVC